MTLSSDAENAVVSKSEFARLCNVSKGRVSQWCAENKLSGAAFVGTGRTAQIDVAIARKQLKRRLDVDRSTGLSGLKTRLASPAGASVGAGAVSDSSSSPEPPGGPPVGAAAILPFASEDELADQIKAAKLEGLQRANRISALEEAEATGRYTRTDDVQLEMGRLASQLITGFDGVIGELATAAAAHFGLAQRDVLFFLRSEYRTVRERASAARHEAAEALPALVEDAG